MKIHRMPIVVSSLLALFITCFSYQGQPSGSEKPDFSWLSKPHESVTNPEGIVRSKGHALELGKVAMKYLFGIDKDVDVELVGMYWVAYTKMPKKTNAIRTGGSHYVKLNRVSGGVEEFGVFP
jgi:hypothetical protein